MGLERSDMTGTVLGTAFSLLLLAPVIQGFNNKVVVEVFHDKTTEAAVGQNVSLPCIVENKPDLKIVQIEWRKRDGNDTKLVVHSKGHGTHTFKPSIALQLKTNDSLEYGLLGSYLQIHRVEKQDSGIYVCDITTYPLGSISTETELKVKDDQIKCNMNNTFEVNAGENVTIHCTAHTSSDAQYQWTKDKKLVSESESLELWWVSDAQAGVYTLTVNTGSNRLHAMFNITILTATTSLGTGLITASPPSNVTEEDWIHTRTPADIAHATSRTIQQPSAATNVTWTMSNIITSDEKQTTSLGTFPSTTDRENISVTTPPTKQEFSTSTKNLTTTPIPYPSVSSDPSAVQSELFPRNVSEWTTSGNVRPVFRSTQDMTSYETAPDASPVTHAEEPSTLGSVNIISEKPDVSSTVSSKNNLDVVIEKGGGELTYVLLIIFPILALIALVGISYWRRKRRMDLPPPFKPPPPPVKYSSLRPHEILMTDIVSS
ncbi:uncharacterized protein ACJ7VT_006903 isoform 2-T2 [Polymixia lowei]